MILLLSIRSFPKQISHVFSIDGNYRMSPTFSLGAKVGVRKSEIALRSAPDDFYSSTAVLTVLRADWNFVKQWDILAEGRVLTTRETGYRETGALIGVYRQVNEHVKIGVGHEWGTVSSDLTDLDYSGKGVFLNIVGTF